MLITALTYLVLGLGAVAILTHMILKIGNSISDCPVNGKAARVVSATTATGFAAIGTGGVLLGGAGLALFANNIALAVPLVTGFVTLCLGLGFLRAMEALRDALPTQPQATI